jgi:hypothetical protein
MEVDHDNTFPQHGVEAAQDRKPQARLGAKRASCKIAKLLQNAGRSA